MKPSTAWIAIVLLALGICGILDATGVAESSQTIGQWWPVAILGWAASQMLTVRRVTLGGVICAAIGLTLLADTQAWASDALLWSSLAIAIGLAILVEASLRRVDRHDANDTRAAIRGGASQ
jgi:sugar phosphate permease